MKSTIFLVMRPLQLIKMKPGPWKTAETIKAWY